MANRFRILAVAFGAILIGVGIHASRSEESVAAPRRITTAATARAQARPLPSAAQAPAVARPESGTVVATVPWGGGPSELGRRAANESSPEGPMSFVSDERGRLYVLDQVNSRISVFEDGKAARTIALPGDTYQDIALRGDDGFVALDRHVSESVAFVDLSGNVTHQIELAGTGISSGGDVTGLFQERDGTWVEVKHEGLVQIADADGNPLPERRTVAGRFASGGKLLRLSKSGASAASIAVIDPGARPRALARVEFSMRVWQLLALESDARGRILVAADLYEEAPAPSFERIAAAEQLVLLDASGVEVARFELPASDGAEESFRRLRMSADGTIHHMAFGERGVTFRRIEP